MTKAEFTDRLADRLGVRRKEAASILDSLLTEISKALQQGEKVQLIPFGSFEVRERKAREGRNPRTGEKIQISGRKVVVFQAGKAVREALGG